MVAAVITGSSTHNERIGGMCTDASLVYFMMYFIEWI